MNTKFLFLKRGVENDSQMTQLTNQDPIKNEASKTLEPLCCKKWQKKVPVKKLVWGIGDVSRS